jgi:hypothetical protein
MGGGVGGIRRHCPQPVPCSVRPSDRQKQQDLQIFPGIGLEAVDCMVIRGAYWSGRPAPETLSPVDAAGDEFASIHRPRCSNTCTESGEQRGCEGFARPSSLSRQISAQARDAEKLRTSCVFPAKEEKRAKGLEPSTSRLWKQHALTVKSGKAYACGELPRRL